MPLSEQRFGAELLVEPEARLFPFEKCEQFVVAPSLKQAGQRQGGSGDVGEPRVIRPGSLDHVEIAIRVQVHQRG